MLESIFALLGILCMLALLGAVVALPIFALIQFSKMRERLADLEREIKHLRKHAPPLDVEPEPIPVVVAVTEQEPPAASLRKRKPPSSAAAGPDWAKLEGWLGVRGLGWAAVVLMLLTASFFLKLVFDRGLIGELGRIMVGVGVGAGLTILGWLVHRRERGIFCQMLTAAGIAVLYLSMFATFGFYQLVPQEWAAPFLIVLVVESFALAALYRAPSIAIMAVLGGLANPVLLDSGRDQYVGLFTYLVILNAGVVGLSGFRRWWGVTTLALVGTHGVFWMWFYRSYHPTKLDASLLFQLAIFALYLGQTVLVQVRQAKRANIEELIRIVLVGGFAASAGYVLLDDRFYFFHVWMGTFAVGLAIVYAGMTVLIARWRRDDEPLLFVSLAMSMAFVAAVFPIQIEAAWIAVGWAIQGLALWWFGLRVGSKILYGMGGAFLALAAGRLLLLDTFTNQAHDTGLFVPIFNRYGFPGTVVAVSLIAAALLQRRTKPAPNSPDFILMRVVGLAGVFVLWIVLSIETYDFFAVIDEHETARMSLSALWAVFALVQLAVGLRLEHRPLRWLGLGLFAITLLKVMLLDTANLQGLYRVGAFFALSLMMAAGAWAYQKLRHSLVAAEPEQEHASN